MLHDTDCIRASRFRQKGRSHIVQPAHAALQFSTFPRLAPDDMTNKGLAFSLGGIKKTQAAKPRPGLNKPFKASSLSVFETQEKEGQSKDDMQEKKRQRLEPAAFSGPCAPSDPEVEKVAMKLAEFVARNGRQFEEVTRQRNPGETPFKFLLDASSPVYKWYDQKVLDIRNQLAGVPSVTPVVETPQPSAAPTPHELVSINSSGPRLRFSEAPPGAAAAVDPIAAMEAFAKKAAQAEAHKQQKEERVANLKETSYDRRTVKAIFKDDGTRGHHMQDFIPQDELAKVLAKSGDVAAQEHAKRIEEQSKIGSDNIGHKLLSKMGWTEGSGLGASSSGMAKPISAGGSSAQEKRGLGAKEHIQIEEGDDEFEQYRKRMMLGYKHRPNPLGNPRKNYY